MTFKKFEWKMKEISVGNDIVESYSYDMSEISYEVRWGQSGERSYTQSMRPNIIKGNIQSNITSCKFKAEVHNAYWFDTIYKNEDIGTAATYRWKTFEDVEDAKKWVEKEIEKVFDKLVGKIKELIETYSTNEVKLKKLGDEYFVMAGRKKVATVNTKHNGKFVAIKPELGYGHTMSTKEEIKKYYTEVVFPARKKSLQKIIDRMCD